MIQLIPTTLLLIGVSSWSQPSKKSLQTTRLEKSSSGFNLLVKPLTGHHFNLDAPTRVKKNGQDLSPINITPTVLTIPVAPSEKCELQIQTYVCDDKKTFCAPQNATLSCADLQKNASSVSDLNTQPSTQPSTQSNTKKESSKNQNTESFIVNDPKMALEQAKAMGKPLFIDFFGTWCPPCNILDETVFNNPAFKKRSKDFVLLKLDADDKVSWDLKSKFNVKGYPTIVLATTTGEEITRFSGALPEAQIVKLMNYAVKNKVVSLKQKKAQYQNSPTPSLALEIIDSIVGNDDFISAMAFVPEAIKAPNPKISEKEMLLLIPLLATAKENTEAFSKISLPLLKNLFSSYPVSDLYYQKLELMQNTAEILKDDELKKWVNETNIKNVTAALALPKLNLNNLSKIDLMSMLTDSYEKLGQAENEKKAYADMASEYSKLISKYKQNPLTNRGYNLERVYCLYKSGAVQQARQEYEKLIEVYPNEFTFHYNYASVLKDLKDWESALESAKKALQYSYGDNQLRAVYLVSEIESKKGLRKESLERLTKAIESTELPEDEAVRTHRYVKKLVELKKKIQENKAVN